MMTRAALPLLLLAALSAASCAGFQKGPRPLQDQLEALRLAQLGTEGRLAAVEAKMADLERQKRLEAARKAVPQAEAPPEPASEPPATQAAEALPAPSPAPDSPEGLYEAGLRLLREERKPQEARGVFERFLKGHPQHPLAPNALYWSGECLYDLKDYAGAVLAFKEVAAGFPEHPKAPAALLKMGYSYLGLNDPQNARDYLGRVERLYPESEAAPLARAALQQLDGRLEGPPAEAGKED
jgi:tol-pal system protein YbgF